MSVRWTELDAAPAHPRAPQRRSALSRVQVSFAPGVWEAIAAHLGASPLEEGGLLLGRAPSHGAATSLAGGPPTAGAPVCVHVEEALPARSREATGVRFAFTRRTWEELSRPLARAAERGLAIVGWFHSHPDLGAFFSGTDRSTQASFFRQPWQVGLVYDPVRDELKLFAGPEALPIAEPALDAPRGLEPTGDAYAYWATRLVRRALDAVTLELEGGLCVRLEGVRAPRLATAPRPVRRLAAMGRRLLRSKLIGGAVRLPLAQAEAARAPSSRRTPIPATILWEGRRLEVYLLERGLIVLDPARAPYMPHALRQAEGRARLRSAGLWNARFRAELRRARSAGGGRSAP